MRDNVYEVTVVASDGANSAMQGRDRQGDEHGGGWRNRGDAGAAAGRN